MVVVVWVVAGDVEEAGGGGDAGLGGDEALAGLGEALDGVELGGELVEEGEELGGGEAVVVAELEEAEVGGEEVFEKGVGDGLGLCWCCDHGLPRLAGGPRLEGVG